MTEADASRSDLPLVIGATGEGVRDLQRRLGALGFEVPPVEHGRFDKGTQQAVCRFQAKHGLHADGLCDSHTWNALVEAGYRLGDRLLYLRRPMLRGDDVLELQRRLDALGFDPRWQDGIFGPSTERALKDFQRNAALTTDGVCGPDVRATLARLGERGAGHSSVAAVRERERLREAPRHLEDRRVAVGDTGDLGALTNALARRLTEAGAVVLTIHDPDPSQQAQKANAFEAEAYIGLGLTPSGGETAYYSTPDFSSEGGHKLATRIAEQLATVLEATTLDPQGLRLPILRETRMPAVWCLLGPPAVVVERTADIADALLDSVTRWVADPI